MQHLLKQLAAIAMLCLCLTADAQFKGGAGHGEATLVMPAASLGISIFRGGADDGLTMLAAPAAGLGVNIFRGGDDDGFTTFQISSAMLGINIYRGGADDGITSLFQSNASLGTNIYRGGSDDGFANKIVPGADFGPNIFKGGGDDGWAVSQGLFIPLPVSLGRFSGEWQLDDALIKWETLTEHSSDHFELQRSYDGQNFTGIGRVEAAGESAQVREYQFTDAQVRKTLPAGLAYYRLKTIDRDGSAALSAVVILQSRDASTAYTIFPNPARNIVTLQITGMDQPVRAVMSLYDMTGKLVSQAVISANRQSIDIRQLKPATYVLILVLDGKAVFSQKIIVQK